MKMYAITSNSWKMLMKVVRNNLSNSKQKSSKKPSIKKNSIKSIRICTLDSKAVLKPTLNCRYKMKNKVQIIS